MVNNFNALACTDLEALILANICHLESKNPKITPDDEHLTTIREAVSALTRQALMGKFHIATNGVSPRARALIGSMADNGKDYPR